MVTLDIYMKSGNVIKVRDVEDWNATVRVDGITSLSLTYAEHAMSRLKVATLALSQIEGIVQTVED